MFLFRRKDYRIEIQKKKKKKVVKSFFQMVYYRALRQHYCQTKSFKHSSKRNVSMMVIGKHRAYLRSLRHHIKGFIITFLVSFSRNLHGKTLDVGSINATRISSPPDNFLNWVFSFYSCSE
ncbi:CDN_1a_G0025580.mRNA.1.CDS.1 [Saccharomyces cerevisiae]|nr:CDN_1a_G0025580.mRNA.1.CDS.1 [Saccharomyces cerevisiae]CAI7233409.1 CDN_1a_G0025580.mRNA.1.CDS.1 [Saccharomyces cerevisiae]